MKFGMNLLLWTGEMHDGLIPVLEMLKNLGYDGVEVPIFNTFFQTRLFLDASSSRIFKKQRISISQRIAILFFNQGNNLL